MRVVFDTNVVVAGAGWRGESFLCLVALARRRVQAFASAWILEDANSWVGCGGPSDPPASARGAAQPEASSYLRFACGLLLLEAGDPRVVGQRGPGLFAAIQTMVQKLVNHKN